MDRLVTFGCSFTQGIGLDGKPKGSMDPAVFDNPPLCAKDPSPHYKDCWSELAADKLGLECVNLGRGGTSPKFMFQTIREFDFHSTDIVVIQWPSATRGVIWDENGFLDLADPDNHQHIPPHVLEPARDTDFRLKSPRHNEISVHDRNAEKYYSHYNTDLDSVYDVCVLIENTYNYLKDTCRYFYMVTSESDIHLGDPELFRIFPVLNTLGEFFGVGLGPDSIVLGYNPFRAPLESLSPEMIQCNDGHPGKQYHIEFAEDIVEKIKQQPGIA